jgi:mRNA interferase MazF
MVKPDYIPERGDLIWIEFSPQAGHEQSGKRPALVISPHRYNQKSGLCLLVPVTGKVKGYPFEVPISTQEVSGVILADQIKNLDWKARNARFICKVPSGITRVVIDLIRTLIE